MMAPRVPSSLVRATPAVGIEDAYRIIQVGRCDVRVPAASLVGER